MLGRRDHYSIPIGGAKSEYAVWTYEKPYEAVASIKEHLASHASMQLKWCPERITGLIVRLEIAKGGHKVFDLAGRGGFAGLEVALNA